MCYLKIKTGNVGKRNNEMRSRNHRKNTLVFWVEF